jgi:hypothetical protein
VNAAEILEYTTFTDKNEKECYHKDIIKTSPHGRLYIIEYGDWTNDEKGPDAEYGYGFYLNPIKKEKWIGATHLYNINTSEIIGNAYENPELLNDEA